MPRACPACFPLAQWENTVGQLPGSGGNACLSIAGTTTSLLAGKGGIHSSIHPSGGDALPPTLPACGSLPAHPLPAMHGNGCQLAACQLVQSVRFCCLLVFQEASRLLRRALNRRHDRDHPPAPSRPAPSLLAPSRLALSRLAQSRPVPSHHPDPSPRARLRLVPHRCRLAASPSESGWQLGLQSHSAGQQSGASACHVLLAATCASFPQPCRTARCLALIMPAGRHPRRGRRGRRRRGPALLPALPAHPRGPARPPAPPSHLHPSRPPPRHRLRARPARRGPHPTPPAR